MLHILQVADAACQPASNPSEFPTNYLIFNKFIFQKNQETLIATMMAAYWLVGRRLLPLMPDA